MNYEDTDVSMETAYLSIIVTSMPGIAEKTLKTMLESLPWVRIVGTAAGCLSALHMVYEKQPDLVVLDSNLPAADVQAFVRQLAEEGLSTRSLVLCATDSQIRGALTAGADSALRRDVNITQLRAILARFRCSAYGNMDGPTIESA